MVVIKFTYQLTGLDDPQCVGIYWYPADLTVTFADFLGQTQELPIDWGRLDKHNPKLYAQISAHMTEMRKKREAELAGRQADTKHGS